LPTILPQDRKQVEVLPASAHLEADSLGRASVEDEQPVSEHAMDEVYRSVIENDDVEGLAEGPLELVDQAEPQPIEGRSGVAPEEDAEVDVTAVSGFVPRHAPEEVGHQDPSVVIGEESAQRVLDVARVHASTIRQAVINDHDDGRGLGPPP
jgi:hypothetical protein